MPRPLRIEYENAWYHVMNRGAGRKNIFYGDGDRILFLEVLKEATILYKIEIHAYCLMDNHYHLLIKTTCPNLGRAMKHINGVYTQRHNRSTRTDGSLFRGRYKAIVIDKDNYFLQVHRYIHLNPVVACLVNDLLEYRWSSYIGYINPEEKPEWLYTNEILMLMDCKDPVTAYKNFIQAGIDFEIKNFYKSSAISSILGDTDFKNTLLEKLELKRIKSSLTDYKRTRELPTMQLVNQVCDEYFQSNHTNIIGCSKHAVRNIRIYLCRMVAMEKLLNVANFFQFKSANTVSDIVRVVEELRKIDSDLEQLICALENEIRMKLKRKSST